MELTMLFMGKSTISMAMFNSYVTNYQRVSHLQMADCPYDGENGTFIVDLPMKGGDFP